VGVSVDIFKVGSVRRKVKGKLTRFVAFMLAARCGHLVLLSRPTYIINCGSLVDRVSTSVERSERVSTSLFAYSSYNNYKK
jgi:hypothetical protein